jgi:enamine deaminase RidA (YjgF/YER057c/UK114 family)
MIQRQNIPANAPWARSICYSRAVRAGSFIAVSQTSAVDESGRIAGGNDPYAQAVHALRNAEAALRAAGAGLADVVRTRIYLARFEDLASVARAHAERFGDIRPALSIVTCPMVSSEILVEFEVDAIVGETR